MISWRVERCVSVGRRAKIFIGAKFWKTVRALTKNRNSPEASTALVRVAQKNVFNCMNRSQLGKAFNPFGELALTDAPLAADLESRYFPELDHTVRCSLRHLQQLSGFLEGQQVQRLLNVIFRRSFHASEIEQRQCHCPAG